MPPKAGEIRRIASAGVARSVSGPVMAVLRIVFLLVVVVHPLVVSGSALRRTLATVIGRAGAGP